MSKELSKLLEQLRNYKEKECLDYSFKLLIDYIDELEEKINTYEDPKDLTLMFMYCEEKTKDKIKELQNKIDKLEDELDWYKQECDDLEMASGECENRSENNAQRRV